MDTKTARGVIKRISQDISYRPYTECKGWVCEFTILADDGHLLPVRYSCPSEELALTVKDSLEKGAEVEVTLEQAGSHFYVRALKVLANATTEKRPIPSNSGAARQDVGHKNDGEAFSRREQQRLLQGIEQLKSAIGTTFHPTDDQMDRISRRLDELSRKLHELGRFSWRRFFVNVIVGIAVDLGFGFVPGVLLDLIKNIFSQISFIDLKFDQVPELESGEDT